MLAAFKAATVTGIARERPGCLEISVDVEGIAAKAICYPDLIGKVRIGDRVILNTTAVQLELGSGGYHYVLWNLNNSGIELEGSGHIMKMRYTPMQIKCQTVEESSSQYFEILKDSTSIDGMPVVIGTLHSQLPAAAVMIKELLPEARVAYIMTDGAALPIAFSRLVTELKAKRFIDVTITIGHAFGGDLEAINIYSGLTAARHAAGADVVIVTMGPGIVGTASKLGFTGIEQGQIINAVCSLQGKPIVIPRISFKDDRERHYGISHHTVTALMIAAIDRAVIAVPALKEEHAFRVQETLKQSGIAKKHDIVSIDARETIDTLKRVDVLPTTMGRSVDQDQAFFMAAGAAGIYAVKLLKETRQ